MRSAATCYAQILSTQFARNYSSCLDLSLDVSELQGVKCEHQSSIHRHYYPTFHFQYAIYKTRIAGSAGDPDSPRSADRHPADRSTLVYVFFTSTRPHPSLHPSFIALFVISRWCPGVGGGLNTLAWTGSMPPDFQVFLAHPDVNVLVSSIHLSVVVLRDPFGSL